MINSYLGVLNLFITPKALLDAYSSKIYMYMYVLYTTYRADYEVLHFLCDVIQSQYNNGHVDQYTTDHSYVV